MCSRTGGAQANSAVFWPVTETQRQILGLDLSMGGHLTRKQRTTSFSGIKTTRHLFYGVKRNRVGRL